MWFKSIRKSKIILLDMRDQNIGDTEIRELIRRVIPIISIYYTYITP